MIGVYPPVYFLIVGNSPWVTRTFPLVERIPFSWFFVFTFRALPLTFCPSIVDSQWQHERYLSQPDWIEGTELLISDVEFQVSFQSLVLKSAFKQSYATWND